MSVARWTGIMVAALAFGCASQQSQSRGSGSTAAAQPRDADRGGGANATPSNAEASSQRPSAGEGAQGGTVASTAPAKSDVKELPDVHGRLTRVSPTEIEVTPESGDAVRLEVDQQTMVEGREGAISSLREGQDVRASYDERKGGKVAVDVRTGSSSATTPSSTGSSTSPSSTRRANEPATTGGTSGRETGTTTGGNPNDVGHDTTDTGR